MLLSYAREMLISLHSTTVIRYRNRGIRRHCKGSDLGVSAINRCACNHYEIAANVESCVGVSEESILDNNYYPIVVDE